MNIAKFERRIEALEAQGRKSLQSLSDEELTARILGLIPQRSASPSRPPCWSAPTR